MSVKKVVLSSCKVKLSFTLKPEEFNAALDKAFEKQVKNLEVPGFRKGKMPRSMFEKRYGEAALYEDAINFTVNEAYVEYLQKSKLLLRFVEDFQNNVQNVNSNIERKMLNKDINKLSKQTIIKKLEYFIEILPAIGFISLGQIFYHGLYYKKK